MSDVYIVGIDMIKFEALPGPAVPSSARRPRCMALDDAA